MPDQLPFVADSVGPAFAVRSTLPARILLVALIPRTLASVAEAVLRARARPLTFTVLYAAELPLHLAGVYFLVRAWGIECRRREPCLGET